MVKKSQKCPPTMKFRLKQKVIRLTREAKKLGYDLIPLGDEHSATETQKAA